MHEVTDADLDRIDPRSGTIGVEEHRRCEGRMPAELTAREGEHRRHLGAAGPLGEVPRTHGLA